MGEVYYIVKTNYGVFSLKVTLSSDRNTGEPISFMLNLGTKNYHCVQISVPSKESKKTEAYLIWVESDEQCSLERYIEKGLAQHMTLLGLTLARSINKNLKTVYFKDTSSFECELPDGTEKNVPMKLFHIAFHGSTWYEYYFGAKLKNGYDKYCELKQNLYNPASKPKTYYFVNNQLQRELDPLFESTPTWHEFFEAIAKKYDKKKCTVIYPWIISAISDILTSDTTGYVDWYIEFKDNPKVPLIDYTAHRMPANLKGGRRKTIKKRRARRFTFSRTHIFPHIRKIQGWNYLKFLYG